MGSWRVGEVGGGDAEKLSCSSSERYSRCPGGMPVGSQREVLRLKSHSAPSPFSVSLSCNDTPLTLYVLVHSCVTCDVLQRPNSYFLGGELLLPSRESFAHFQYGTTSNFEGEKTKCGFQVMSMVDLGAFVEVVCGVGGGVWSALCSLSGVLAWWGRGSLAAFTTCVVVVAHRRIDD